MITKELIRIKVEDLIPYERNPRKIPQEAIDDVRESIRQCGSLDPIEIDENDVILAGHTRRLAYMAEGVKEVDALRYTGLTEEQKKKYRLLANKTGEKSKWDIELLNWELQDLDFEGYDFGFDINIEIDTPEEKYTRKTDAPQYEPSETAPDLRDLVNKDKYAELVRDIEESNVSEDEKAFLKVAAVRHLVFSYKKIADYYANATPEMQELMERSALVIIDFDDAIANGYAKLSKRMRELRDA